MNLFILCVKFFFIFFLDLKVEMKYFTNFSGPEIYQLRNFVDNAKTEIY